LSSTSIKLLASYGFLDNRFIPLTPHMKIFLKGKCSNRVLLQFLVNTKMMNARYRRPEVIRDRVESLWILLNSGIGWVCNKNHQHETFSHGFSIENPKGDAIKYAKSFNYSVFYGHFYNALLEYRKTISLFKLLLHTLIN